jgi:hypothetical protein
MPNILSTDSRYIKYIDCNPEKQKKVVFEGQFLKIIMGSQVLYSIDMTDVFHPASINGGNFKKRIYIQPESSYDLYGGNIAQDQGEVSLVIIKVKYDKSLLDSERLIHWEYKGNLFPLKNILFLTGKTLDHIKHHGWDLEPYNVVGDTVSPGITSPVVDPEFVPLLSPQPTTPDLSLGGIVIRNTTLKEIELEILVIN